MSFTSQAEIGRQAARGPGRVFKGFTTLRAITCVIGVTAMSGCSQPSGSPVAPSSGAPPAPSPPAAPRAAPAVTDIVPAAGSAGGGATIKIVGTGFMPGMVAIFDGLKVVGRYDSRDTSFSTFYAETPAHAPGIVDLIVTNPDGQSHGVAGGYTYAPQESFDLSGSWRGSSFDGTDISVEFVIQDNRLVSASCAYEVLTPFTFADFPTVTNGEFAFSADGGARIAGRIVAASEVVGTISLPPCTTAPAVWRATRKSQ